jgi:mannose-6-phosphate isomerase-like protein (cupin superfamily)
MNPVTSPQRIAAGLTELWSPRVIGEIENVYLKVAKLQGSLAWHSHDHEDELFLVLKGSLRIELETGPVDLAEGELFIVPKGVRHNPIAEQECQVLLIESKTTLHTGSTLTEKTRSIAEQLRPLLPPGDSAAGLR